MELNKRYIIDLSQAKSPADIVFELSNIIEKPEAANQKIWLKLGDIQLNQSQILSINSLINSINSTLSLIESQSQQTELAAATLGICTKDVEEEIKEELEQNTPEAPLNTDFEKPTEQYIPMTDHIDNELKNTEENSLDKEASEEVEEVEEAEDAEEDNASEENPENKSDKTDKSNEKDNETTSAEIIESKDDAEKTEDKKDEIEYPFLKKPEDIQEQTENSSPVSQTNTDEEIKDELDSIFDSETKLENILSDDKDINAMKNWPLTKETGIDSDIEIPEEEMTDEDYEILQMNTQYHKQTVRSGQVIKSNGNVVIIGDCHPGCEIHAAGDITVWGILGGIAHAGCNGNTRARIRALNLNAIQLRIADSYARRPDHIKNIYVEKSNTFTPEEARNINGSIVILKINDK